MGADSRIQWTHHTFNPWIGCAKVSAGCRNCYAETLMDTRYGRVRWGVNGTRSRTSEANWRKPLQWDRQAEAAGERHRVFCASLADVFEDRAELRPWRADLFRLIEATPHLDWLLLTKRPENVGGMTPDHWWVQWPRNVWMGTSVEDQETANTRVPILLEIPAPVRFLSCEPLLEPVDLEVPTPREVERAFREGYGASYAARLIDGLDWLIVGGESGPNARPFDLSWARSLLLQGRRALVPVFVKQLGSLPIQGEPGRDFPGLGLGGELDLADQKGGDLSEWPEDLRVREWPEVCDV